MTTATREKPILFSGPMVRAILDGRKTQTRRICKPRCKIRAADDLRWLASMEWPEVYGAGGVWLPMQCPYGQVGSQLWVRETFGDRGEYAAIGTLHHGRFYYAADGRKAGWKYKPSIHMPRVASRITLEITDVRVQRVQEISAKDILAEGVVERSHNAPILGKCPISAFDKAYYPDLKSVWAAAWERVNGKGAWKRNDWCWAITFKRIQP